MTKPKSRNIEIVGKPRIVVLKCQTPKCGKSVRLRVWGHDSLEDEPYICPLCMMRRTWSKEDVATGIHADIKRQIAEKAQMTGTK